MAELYRHTDEDGYRVVVNSQADGDIMVLAYPVHDFDRITAVDVPAVDGRRLLAELLRYYGSEEITKEEERHG